MEGPVWRPESPESHSKPGIEMVYPEPCEELGGSPRHSATTSGYWPFVTFIYPGFEPVALVFGEKQIHQAPRLRGSEAPTLTRHAAQKGDEFRLNEPAPSPQSDSTGRKPRAFEGPFQTEQIGWWVSGLLGPAATGNLEF